MARGMGHGVEEYPGQPVLGGVGPCREDQPAAGTQHARELGHGALGTREVHDHQVADDSVEGGVGERQLVRIRPTGTQARGERFERGRSSLRTSTPTTDAPRAAAGRLPTRARGHVQDPRADTNRSGGKERLDHPTGDNPEESLIGGRLLLPPRCLEGVESVGVNGARTPRQRPYDPARRPSRSSFSPDATASPGRIARDGIYAQGRRGQLGGRCRPKRSNAAFASLQSEVSSATLAPYWAASAGTG